MADTVKNGAKGVALLAAGGTGGHLFPAEALAHELIDRGYEVHLVTDERAERYAAHFPAREVHVIPSATLAGKNPVVLARAAGRLVAGYVRSRRLIRRLKPVVAVGFGGYPTLPPILAAMHKDVPVVLHDANAVMGRANRWLASRASLSAMGFPPGEREGRRRIVVTGNPVRPAILAAAAIPYREHKAGEPFELLVFGGSQGAQFFGHALPEAVGLLDEEARGLLHVVQQAREEDREGVSLNLRRHGVKATVATFFSDMAKHLSQAHLVICRAGASTVSELAVIGRSAILVPYPYALDHDQAMNARALAEAGGARIEPQDGLTPQRLAQLIAEAMKDPAGLARIAKKAKKTGMPDAAQRLADCVEHVADNETGGGTAEDFITDSGGYAA